MKIIIFVLISISTLLNAFDFSINRYLPKEPLYQGYIQGFYKIISAEKEDINTVRYVYMINQEKLQEAYKKAAKEDFEFDIRITRNFVNRIMKKDLEGSYCNDINHRLDINGVSKPNLHYVYFNSKNQLLSEFILTPSMCKAQ